MKYDITQKTQIIKSWKSRGNKTEYYRYVHKVSMYWILRILKFQNVIKVPLKTFNQKRILVITCPEHS